MTGWYLTGIPKELSLQFDDVVSYHLQNPMTAQELIFVLQ
jgi:hypothetical protein